ncbi:hypothetical protein J6590_037267 [Homalodisca vitripennis]|nr:hypothetical protein J6590_037267 [Homalodisca vitripennis]
MALATTITNSAACQASVTHALVTRSEATNSHPSNGYGQPSPPATEHHWHRHVTRARGHSRLQACQACSGMSSIGHSRTELEGTRDYKHAKRAAACQASVTHALVTRSEATNSRPSNGYGQPSPPATEHHWHRHVTRARGHSRLQACQVCSGMSSIGHSRTGHSVRSYQQPSNGHGQPSPPATEHHWHCHVTRIEGTRDYKRAAACQASATHALVTRSEATNNRRRNLSAAFWLCCNILITSGVAKGGSRGPDPPPPKS